MVTCGLCGFLTSSPHMACKATGWVPCIKAHKPDSLTTLAFRGTCRLPFVSKCTNMCPCIAYRVGNQYAKQDARHHATCKRVCTPCKPWIPHSMWSIRLLCIAICWIICIACRMLWNQSSKTSSMYKPLSRVICTAEHRKLLCHMPCYYHSMCQAGQVHHLCMVVGLVTCTKARAHARNCTHQLRTCKALCKQMRLNVTCMALCSPCSPCS